MCQQDDTADLSGNSLRQPGRDREVEAQAISVDVTPTPVAQRATRPAALSLRRAAFFFKNKKIRNQKFETRKEIDYLLLSPRFFLFMMIFPNIFMISVRSAIISFLQFSE